MATDPVSCQQLRQRFESCNNLPKGELLTFKGVESYDIYNPTPPLLLPYKGQKIFALAARIEKREDENHSQIGFFVNKNNEWHLLPDAPMLRGQDPAIAFICGWTVLSVVRASVEKQRAWWQTEFYRSRDIRFWEKFAIGPPMMKDIRLIESPSGKIGVFTRPQGKVGGRGTIGYLEIDSLEEINPERLQQAQLLTGMFKPEEWGGANDLIVLPNGWIGVIGHIARWTPEKQREYLAMAFVYCPAKHYFSSPQIIATPSQFPIVEPKKSDLQQVIFPGGIDWTAHQPFLYAGISDTKAGRIKVNLPF